MATNPKTCTPHTQVLQPLWDASEATGVMTLERLEGLFDIMLSLARDYQLGSIHV